MFRNSYSDNPWYNQAGPTAPVGPTGPVGPGGGETPVATTLPACSTTLNQCPCSYGGCTDSAYLEYDVNATCDNGSCATLIVNGCTDPTAFNYDPTANNDDGSCIPVVQGCANPTAANYNPNANTDCSNNPISNFQEVDIQIWGVVETTQISINRVLEDITTNYGLTTKIKRYE